MIVAIRVPGLTNMFWSRFLLRIKSYYLLLLEARAYVTHPLLREEVIVLNYTTPSHGYHLSHKTSYNLHSSDLIGTDVLFYCLAWWSEPS